MAFKKHKDFEFFSKKIYLSSPTMHGEELNFMAEAFHTNWMSTVGENINVLERAMATQIGCEYAVALASGTAALHLCIKLAGVKPGERVFCSDMTFAATVNPVMYEKAEPVFIDSERDTWNMDPNALERAFALYPEVRVVVIANLYGVPAKMDALRAVCRAHNALLIEDAAESLGATYRGKQTGSFGDLAAISFNGNKIITGTAGGMLLCNDREMSERARKWSTQSREAAPWYQHEELGYNYRMSNVVAGVARGQLPHLGEHIAQKKAVFERYRAGFADLPLTMNPHEENIAQPNYWLSCALLDPAAMCPQIRGTTTATYQKEAGRTCPTEILETLAAYNAEGRPIWKPMHMQPLYQNFDFVTRSGSKLQGTVTEDVGADIFARGLCLPSDNKMTEDEQDRIIALVRACFA